MCAHIDWTSFSWEAFATLATGFAAVLGAVVIGLRQLGINEKQVAVAARQVRADELAVRAALFDRRFEVYRAAKAYLREAGAIRIDSERDILKWQTFVEQLEQAQFLFDQGVRARLEKLASEADDLLDAREEARNAWDADLPDKVEKRRHVTALKQQLYRRIGSLAETLGEEMALYVSDDGGRLPALKRRGPETSHPQGAK